MNASHLFIVVPAQFPTDQGKVVDGWQLSAPEDDKGKRAVRGIEVGQAGEAILQARADKLNEAIPF